MQKTIEHVYNVHNVFRTHEKDIENGEVKTVHLHCAFLIVFVSFVTLLDQMHPGP